MGRVAKQQRELQPIGTQEAVGSLTGFLLAHWFREEASITCQSPGDWLGG